jgi:hypothetical protein
MRTGIGHTGIGILLLLIRNLRVRLGHVLEIRGLLDKLLIRAMFADEFEILNMLGLHMVVHGILLSSTLITVLALKLAGL